jgi:hypothetical protein
MTRYERKRRKLEIALNRVKVCMTDPARLYPYENLSLPGFWNWDVGLCERVLVDRTCTFQKHYLHR